MTAGYAGSRVERVLFPAVCFYLALVGAVWAAVFFRIVGVTPGTVTYRVVVVTHTLWAAWLARRSAVLLLLTAATAAVPLGLFAARFAASWPNPGRQLHGLLMLVEFGMWCGPVITVVMRAVRRIGRPESVAPAIGPPHLLAASLVFVVGVLAVLALGPR